MAAPDLHAALLDGLRAAAAGAFTPTRFYRVRVSPRREKRYRRPGRAATLGPRERRAIQALRLFEGRPLLELARMFHRDWKTIRKALRDPDYQAHVSAALAEPGAAPREADTVSHDVG